MNESAIQYLAICLCWVAQICLVTDRSVEEQIHDAIAIVVLCPPCKTTQEFNARRTHQGSRPGTPYVHVYIRTDFVRTPYKYVYAPTRTLKYSCEPTAMPHSYSNCKQPHGLWLFAVMTKSPIRQSAIGMRRHSVLTMVGAYTYIKSARVVS